jgi:hypothetical protein
MSKSKSEKKDNSEFLDENIENVENLDFNFTEDISEEIEMIDENFIEDVIEIEGDELKIDIETETSEDVVFSKHSIFGKHSLKYDSIFKGKKEEPVTEESAEYRSGFNENFEVDKSSHYWYESIDNENYVKEKRVKEKVYEVLSDHTDLNFLNNRRKPSRSDFNHYYFLLKTHLHQESFSNVELFNELAVYFSDNLFNMFKLLDNKWRNMIIAELQDHIGRQNYSNEIRNRNIFIGTEIEFIAEDPFDDDEMIRVTGVVIETDYHSSTFKVNSYEKIYDVDLDKITKILNNTKFKYNLNKLNNIDFL